MRREKYAEGIGRPLAFDQIFSNCEGTAEAHGRRDDRGSTKSGKRNACPEPSAVINEEGQRLLEFLYPLSR